MPAAALHPAASTPVPPAASSLHAGTRAWVRLPGTPLWAAAEVASVDAQQQCCTVVALQGKRRHTVPLSAIALAAHAPDPQGSDDEEGGGVSLRLLSRGSRGYGSGSGSESGSDLDEGWDEEEEGEEGEGGGDADFGAGRLSSAMAEAASLQQQQAESGPQTGTCLFFASEGHSRGIGSKASGRGGPACRQLATCCAVQLAVHARRLSARTVLLSRPLACPVPALLFWPCSCWRKWASGAPA